MGNQAYTVISPPEDFPEKGKMAHGQAYEHHIVWWKNTGELPDEDEVIHHINEDKTDNRFENLEKKKNDEHSYDHHFNNVTRTMLGFCLECSDFVYKDFRNCYLNKSGGWGLFCGRSCGGKYSRKDQEEKLENIWKRQDFVVRESDSQETKISLLLI